MIRKTYPPIDHYCCERSEALCLDQDQQLLPMKYSHMDRDRQNHKLHNHQHLEHLGQKLKYLYPMLHLVEHFLGLYLSHLSNFVQLLP